MAEDTPGPAAAQRAGQQEFDRLAAAGAFSTELAGADRATSRSSTRTQHRPRHPPPSLTRPSQSPICAAACSSGRRWAPGAAGGGRGRGHRPYVVPAGAGERGVRFVRPPWRRCAAHAPSAPPRRSPAAVIPGLLVAALWLSRDAGEGLAIGDMAREIPLLAPPPGGPDPSSRSSLRRISSTPCGAGRRKGAPVRPQGGLNELAVRRRRGRLR